MNYKALKANTSYHLKITGKLQEKIGNTWQPVINKVNNVAIAQTKHLYFKTNSDEVVVISNTTNNIKNQTNNVKD
jgi:hypothetical protein